MTISERIREILINFFFFTNLNRGNLEENFDWFKKIVFDQISESEQILTYTFFLLKVSHIQLYYDFLLF